MTDDFLRLPAEEQANIIQTRATRRCRVWLEEHAGAIDDANKFLERRNLWSDGMRQF